MTVTIFIAFTLVAVTFVFHYRVLLWLSLVAQKLTINTSTQVLMIVLVLFLAHLVEIGVYALAYAGSVSVLGLGEFQGRGSQWFLADYLVCLVHLSGDGTSMALDQPSCRKTISPII